MQTHTKRCSFERLPSPQAGPEAWKAHLDRHWSRDGGWAEPPFLSVDEVRVLLRTHMPELLPDFEALLPLFGNDPSAAQGLAMYNLKPFWAGCSESIARRSDRTTLIRNYDLGIADCPNAFRYEELAGGGWIIGSAAGGWGYLDGMNDRGLAISLTFGGRFVTGPGFVVLLVVRWLLQTCTTVEEAVARLEGVPARLSQNLLLVDRTGAHAVVYLSPDRGFSLNRGMGACTNHQGVVDIPEHARFTRTVERLEFMNGFAGALTPTDFLRPPLYNQHYREHFGTLYTVEYDPVGLTAHYVWPERDLLVEPGTAETSFTVTLEQAG